MPISDLAGLKHSLQTMKETGIPRAKLIWLILDVSFRMCWIVQPQRTFLLVSFCFSPFTRQKQKNKSLALGYQEPSPLLSYVSSFWSFMRNNVIGFSRSTMRRSKNKAWPNVPLVQSPTPDIGLTGSSAVSRRKWAILGSSAHLMDHTSHSPEVPGFFCWLQWKPERQHG